MGRVRVNFEELVKRFPGRVTTDALERRIHSHDAGVPPRLLRPLIGRGVAEAVVQPRSEEEVVALVRWAGEHGVPLTPRARATSGYGGVIPVRGGIVLDLSRLQNIVRIDLDALTATVEPAVVWQDLERALTEHGLALCLYPSSAPASTVGGWLAQGGVGYGSYEYGCFKDNVVSARVLLPNGQMRTFQGAGLDLIGDAEGITGIILEVTLRVRWAGEERIAAAEFSSAEDLVEALRDLAARRVPLWSASFANPAMAALRNRLPPKAASPAQPLPEAYLVLLVAPAERWAAVESALAAALAAHRGRRLPDELAAQVWGERFRTLRIKRLGPSLVPAEVTVPLAELAAALDGIAARVHRPLAIEGLVSRLPQGGYEAALLGLIPHDERRWGYNAAFGLALSVLRVAKAHGGRAYATGLYFAGEAGRVLGAERLHRLRAFKAQADPQGIMNPGKVLGGGPLASLAGLGQLCEPAVRIGGNLASSPLGDRPQGQGVRGVPDEVAWNAYVCARCGACVGPCPQYTQRTWESQSPRGKFFSFREYMEGRLPAAQAYMDAVYSCTLCARCAAVCPLDIDTRPLWIAMREQLVSQGSFPPGLAVLRRNVTAQHNIAGKDNAGRLAWSENLPPPVAGLAGRPAEMVYFVGCVSAFYPQTYAIPRSLTQILGRVGTDFATLGGEEWCCGYPLLIAGMGDEARALAQHNVAAVRALGAKTLVTTCPSCYHAWRHDYPRLIGEPLGLAVRHASELLADLVDAGQVALGPYAKVLTYHDPCDLGRTSHRADAGTAAPKGRTSGIYEAPRRILRAIPGVELREMRDNRELALCCGGGGDVEIFDGELTAAIARSRLAQAQEVGAEVIVSACQQCKRTLAGATRREKAALRVLDITEVMWQAMQNA